MQGRFQILTLSGSFVYDATQNRRGKNGMLSVALCHPDGNIFGGAVAGALIAAEPVQVSFFFLLFSSSLLFLFLTLEVEVELPMLL